MSVSELFDYLVYIDEQVETCEKPDAPLTPGEWCRWCDAETTCPALEARALSTVSTAFASVREVTAAKLPSPQSLPLDRLAYVLQSADLLKSWLSACEDHALELARHGHNIPGFKLVNTQAKRKWFGDPTHVAGQLMVLTGLTDWDKVMPRKLIGVTDAEALVVKAYKARMSKKDAKKAAEDAKQAMAFLTLKESSGNTTLVPLTDDRPTVNQATTAFSVVNIPQADRT
ncbi:DUF2800 domain-containing protein [Tepidimonas sp.]|uniref:DUF2800 domain-containing protein n=1 Tax=Tepidimonas sp. TaxID=2002775 RepID=UPI00391DD8A6